jgi:archaellum component FlaC
MPSWNNENYVAPAFAAAATTDENLNETAIELRRSAAAARAANAPKNNEGEDELINSGLTAARKSLAEAIVEVSESNEKYTASERSIKRVENLLKNITNNYNTVKLEPTKHLEIKKLKENIKKYTQELEDKRKTFIQAKNRKKRADDRSERVHKAINPDARSALLNTLIGLHPIDNIREQLNSNPSDTYDYHKPGICGPDMRDIAQGGVGMQSWFNNHKCTSANPREWYDRYISSIKCLTGRIFAQEQGTPEVAAKPAIREGRKVVVNARPRIPAKPAEPPDSGHQAAMNYAWAAAKSCYQLIKRYQGKNPVNIKRRLPKNASKRNRKVFTNAVMNRTRRRNPMVFTKNFEAPAKIGYTWAEPYKAIADRIQTELRLEDGSKSSDAKAAPPRARSKSPPKCHCSTAKKAVGACDCAPRGGRRTRSNRKHGHGHRSAVKTRKSRR